VPPTYGLDRFRRRAIRQGDLMMKLGCMSLSLPGLDLDAFIEAC
jgi:hypothetical protein